MEVDIGGRLYVRVIQYGKLDSWLGWFFETELVDRIFCFEEYIDLKPWRVFLGGRGGVNADFLTSSLCL